MNVRAFCGVALACLILAGCGGVDTTTNSGATPSSTTTSSAQNVPSGSSSGSSSTSSGLSISGAPSTAVTVGQTYTFTPVAQDASTAASLTFSISNAPSWASFSTATGQLSGAPTAANVGTYSNITISVSDGSHSVSLGAFTITVNSSLSATGSAMLSWTPPTTNVDGSTLTNLAGYRIYFGTSATSLNQMVQIADTGIASYVIPSLTPGTWYFAIRAYTTNGVESSLSNVGSKTI